MDITPKTKKVMSKDEVALLIDLIQSNPILNSKETNATTNKSKEDTWTTLASVFNARSGSIPRTKEQLKYKWDNLKKGARKRSQQIRMNNLKTVGGEPDETLEKVSSLLGLTFAWSVDPFGGDGVGSGSPLLDLDTVADNGDDSHTSYDSGSTTNEAKSSVPDVDMEVLVETPSKVKKKADDEGRLARNLAITRYYEKKTEKLDLEIKLLRLELIKKENCNCNKFYNK